LRMAAQRNIGGRDILGERLLKTPGGGDHLREEGDSPRREEGEHMPYTRVVWGTTH